MEESLLGSAPDDGRVRRTSAGNLVDDPSSPMSATLRTAAAASHHVDIEVDEGGAPAREPMEVEDALDELGGLSWYQLRHIGLLSIFWFFNAVRPQATRRLFGFLERLFVISRAFPRDCLCFTGLLSEIACLHGHFF